MNGASHTKQELDIEILNLMEHFAFLAVVAVRIDILEVAVNTNLMEASLVIVEAIRDRIGYYGQLGWDTFVLCTKFLWSVVMTHNRLAVVRFDSLQG